MITAFLIFLLSFAGSFVQRVCGFGFGIFIMTILPYLMPTYQEATALSGFLSLIQSGLVLITIRKYLNIRNLYVIFPSFCVFSFFAIKFVSVSDDGVLKIILGTVLILLAVYFLFFSKRAVVTPTLKWQVSLGGLSGIMGGLFGMHGPAAVVYFLSCEKSKEHYLAIAQAYFVITNIYMSFFRAGYGFVTANVGLSLLYALPGIFLGIYFGKKVFERINAQTLKKIIYYYMILAGILQMI
ncbi:MAG: sulfite exporter TauE/SafE family protein [Bacteroidales bacterium]|nr:sulfite exporter TauE/SafE family protein [Bacteroidales bacterium]